MGIRLGYTKLYALDWQHDSFVFSPCDYLNLVKEYYNNEKGCKVYFPSYYPDGDYYFFLDPEWRFGIFGHPWLKQIIVFGEKLIELIDIHLDKLVEMGENKWI